MVFQRPHISEGESVVGSVNFLTFIGKAGIRGGITNTITISGEL